MAAPGRPDCSWVKPAGRPAIAIAPIDQPLMQTERTVLPELDAVRHQQETRPVVRSRHGTDSELRGEFGDALLERETPFKLARLFRRPGADLARPVPGREIGIGRRRIDLLDDTFDTHLPLQRLPVEAEGRLRIGEEGLTLPAFEV